MFLVDRANLGCQTFKEFRQYRSPYNPYKFTEEYIVQQLTSNKRDRESRALRWEKLDEDFAYTAEQLDRDVVAIDQIRTVVRAFKNKLFKEIFPGMPVWQRNYYEHVIRDENDLARIRQYIADNAAKWGEDENNPVNLTGEWGVLQYTPTNGRI